MHTIAINPELSVMCNSNKQPQAAQFNHPVSGAEAGLLAGHWPPSLPGSDVSQTPPHAAAAVQRSRGRYSKQIFLLKIYFSI